MVNRHEFLAIGLQFNYFYNNVLQNQETSSDKPSENSEQNIQLLSKIKEKVNKIVESLNESNETADQIKELNKNFEELVNNFKEFKNKKDDCLKCAETIKVKIEAIRAKIFNISSSAMKAPPPPAEVDEEAEMDELLQDWEMEQSALQALRLYPATYRILKDCINEIDQKSPVEESAKKKLRDACGDGSGEFWSAESIIKLAVLYLIRNRRPLSSLDCFTDSEEARESFKKISTYLNNLSFEKIELLILRKEEAKEDDAECLKEINRLIATHKIARSHFKGMAHRLNNSQFLNELEEFLIADDFKGALERVTPIQRESKKGSGLLFLAQSANTIQNCDSILPEILSFRNEYIREDVLKEYIKMVFVKYPERILEIKGLINRLGTAEARYECINLLVDKLKDINPEAVVHLVTNLRDCNRKDDLLMDLVDHLTNINQDLALIALNHISDIRKWRQQLNSFSKDLLPVSSEKVDIMATKLQNFILDKSKTFNQIFSNIAKNLAFSNPLISLAIVKKMTAEITQKKTFDELYQVILSEAATDPVLVVNSFKYIENPYLINDLCLAIIKHCKMQPMLVIYAFCLLKHKDQKNFEKIKQIVENTNPREVLELLNKTPNSQARNDLLWIIFEKHKRSHPIIALEVILALADPTQKEKMYKALLDYTYWHNLNFDITEGLPVHFASVKFYNQFKSRIDSNQFLLLLDKALASPRGTFPTSWYDKLAEELFRLNRRHQMPQLLEKIENVTERDTSLLRWALKSAEINPVEAINFLSIIDSSEVHDEACRRLSQDQLIIKFYFSLAFQFCTHIENSEMRQGAIKTFVAANPNRYEELITFIDAVQDSQVKSYLYECLKNSSAINFRTISPNDMHTNTKRAGDSLEEEKEAKRRRVSAPLNTGNNVN